MANIRRTSANQSNMTDLRSDRHAVMRKRKKRKTARIIFSVIIPLVVTLGVLIYLGFFFFKVENVLVYGSGFYGEDQVRQAGGIENGEKLFLFNRKAAAEKIEEELPYAASVKIKIVLPATFSVTMSDAVPTSAQKIDGKLFLLDKNLKVLEAQEPYDVAIPVVGGAELLNPPEEGKKLDYKDKQINKIHVDILEALADNNLLGEAKYIDLSDKMALKVQIGRRFVLMLYSGDDLKGKLGFAKSVIEKLEPNDRGYIEIPNIKKSSFIPAGDEIFIYEY